VVALLSSCAQHNRDEDKKSPEALTRIADSLKDSGNYATSARLYEQALTANPKYSPARLGLGKMLRTTGDHDASVVVLKDELTHNPKSTEALRELGKTYIAANMGEDGLQTYTQLLEINNSDPWANNGMAVCHDLCGKHQEAQEYYEKALQDLPNNINIQSNYGLSLALSGKTKESVELLENASHKGPPTPRLKHNLAIAYALSGKPHKAKEIFSKDLSPEEVEQNLSALMMIG
jgi:Flp pilus assembly protein TadD